MLAEFLKALAEQSVKAATVSPVLIDLTKDYVFRDGDGRIEYLHGGPPYRSHEADDLETIVAFANDPQWPNAALWYSSAQVVCLLDGKDRREGVRLTLETSPQWSDLVSQDAGPKGMSQRELLSKLRILYRDNLERAGDIIGVLKVIDWKAGAAGNSNIDRGKSSVGKTITAELQGVKNIPEYVSLMVSPWLGVMRSVHVVVECAIEIDEATQTFKFFPLPGQLDKASVEAEAELHAKLAAMLETVDVPIYHGEP